MLIKQMGEKSDCFISVLH